jgi:hypothetical protein
MPTSKRKTTLTPLKKSRDRSAKKNSSSHRQLLNTGLGSVAYIKPMSSAVARVAFPDVKGLPKKAKLFLLCHADGTTIALTNSVNAAVAHAHAENLWVAYSH